MAHTPELEKLERRYDDDPAKWFAQLAEAYRKYGRVDDALDRLELHLQDRPNYVSALIVLGRCHIDKQNDAEARSAFERVLAIDPENIIALKVLGEVAERAGDADQAREWLTRLLDVDPANDEAREALDRLGGAVAPEVGPAEAPAPEASFGDLAAEMEAPEPVAGFESTVVEEPALAPAEPVEAPTLPMEALPDESAAEQDPADLPLERASREMTPPTEPIEMEPIELERSPEEALPEATPEPAPEPPPPLAETQAELARLAEAGTEPEAQVDADEVELQPFDDSLQWGTGERQSREITQEDIAAAEAAHEETIEHSPVEELPGLESAEVPPPEAGRDVESVEGLVEVEAPAVIEPAAGLEPTEVSEFPPEPAAAEPEPEAAAGPDREAEPEAATTPVGQRGSLAGLPVFLPDDEAAAGSADTASEGAGDAGDGEPEPVVTETMAELYVQQGLVDEARAVYRQLLAQRPGDPRLKERLAALEPSASAKASAPPAGAVTARAFLQSILDGRRVDLPAATPDPAAPDPTGAMDAAFGDEPLDPKGHATRPASSAYSLGQIFGEQSPTPATPPGGPAGTPKKGSGFSFDEFFGGGAPNAPQAGGEDAAEGDDSFRQWLKGLKK